MESRATLIKKIARSYDTACGSLKERRKRSNERKSRVLGFVGREEEEVYSSSLRFSNRDEKMIFNQELVYEK